MKSKVKFLSVFLALGMIVAATAVYIYVSMRDSNAEAAAHPKPAHNQIVKNLIAYHKKNGQFPKTFQQVQDEVWRYPQAPKFGDGGRSFTMANYYYFVGQVEPHTVTLWAVPIGKFYKDGASYFIILQKLAQPAGAKAGEAKEYSFKYWKGPPLDLNQVALLRSDPTEAQLANLLMVLQPSSSGAQSENAGGAKK